MLGYDVVAGGAGTRARIGIVFGGERGLLRDEGRTMVDRGRRDGTIEFGG